MPRQTATTDAPFADDLEAFTVQEVAQRLRVHDDFVYRRVKTGEMGHIRGGGAKSAIRITPSQLAKYIDDHTVG
jgi:excisionase family DNA binding protein